MLKFWDNKPALKIVLPFIAGIIAAAQWCIPSVYIYVASSVFAMLLFVAFLRNQQRLFFAGCLICFAAAGALFFECEQQMPENDIFHFSDLPFLVSIQGTICKPVEHVDDKQIAIMRVDSLWLFDNVFSVQGKVRVTLPDSRQLVEYGDVLVSRGHLRLPRSQRNPGEFDYQKYLAAQGIHAVFSPLVDQEFFIMQNNNGNRFLQSVVYPLRIYIITIIDIHFPDRAAGLLKALLVGSRSGLHDDIKNAFSDAGVIHVLAVSGLHVGYIMLLLMGLFSFVRVPESYRSICVILGLIFYAVLTGLKPPVFRATIMAVVFLSGKRFHRKSDALNSMAIAAFILLAINPNDLFQPGFQLSFSAVTGIVLIYEIFHRRFYALFQKWHARGNKVAVGVLSLFVVSTAAQIATLPFTVFYFNKIPIVAILANLFVIPLVGVIVALAFIAILLSTFSFFLGSILMQTVRLFTYLLLLIVQKISELFFAYLPILQPPVILLVAFAFLILFLVFYKYPQKFYFIVGFLILLNIFIWTDVFSPHIFLKITFLDVGQADAILIEFPNGKTMLIDSGNKSENYCSAESVIYPFLRRTGIKTIDALVLTHEHADHIGGAEYLMRKMNVHRLVKSPVRFSSELAQSTLTVAKELHIPVSTLASGDSLLLDDAVLISCLHPNAHFVENVDAEKENLNNSSLVLHSRYQDHSFLFMGDAEIEAEQRIIATFDSLLKCKVLKCGHHGSETACSAPFLDIVQPKDAIISVGKYNRFSLPDESVIHDLAERNIGIFRTDQHGAVQYLVHRNNVARIR